PRLRVRSLSTVSHRLDEMLGRDRLIAQLSGGFAALALALACLGLYGVMAYAVGARLGEFSLRMALGAERRDILAMVLREAAWLLAVGVAAGLGLSLAAGRLLQPLLPGASATDPVALAAAAALMLVLPLLAGLRPARRGHHPRHGPARITIHAPSTLPQRHRRIHPRRPPRRNVAGRNRHRQQQQRRQRKNGGIARLHAIKETREERSTQPRNN